jgi:hypothetical protein
MRNTNKSDIFWQNICGFSKKVLPLHAIFGKSLAKSGFASAKNKFSAFGLH